MYGKIRGVDYLYLLFCVVSMFREEEVKEEELSKDDEGIVLLLSEIFFMKQFGIQKTVMALLQMEMMWQWWLYTMD